MTPPNPILQKPEKRSVIVRPEANRISSDDLSALKATDAAESRARAAMRLLEDEHQAREALERHNVELERQLKVIAATPVKAEDAKSMRPGVLHLVGKDWKVAIPFTVLVAVAPYAWTVVQRVQGVLQELKDLNTAVASYAKSEEAQNTALTECRIEIANLKTTVARQAGYLAGALPMAGVSVPGAENGAIQVDIEREPDPVGTKLRPKVVTHTRIPAPSPGN